MFELGKEGGFKAPSGSVVSKKRSKQNSLLAKSPQNATINSSIAPSDKLIASEKNV